MTINTSKFHESHMNGYISGEKQKDIARPLLKLRYEYLEDIINAHKYKSICELGSGQGMVVLYLLKNCSNIKEYICIDPDTLRPGKFPEDKFLRFNIPITRYIKNTAINAASEFPDNHFDLIYMDYLSFIVKPGNLLEPLEDCKHNIRVWKNKVKDGGILCGHDYCRTDDRFKQIGQALEEVFPFGVNRIIENQRYLDQGRCVHFWWLYNVNEKQKEIEHYQGMKQRGEIDEKKYNSLLHSCSERFKKLS